MLYSRSELPNGFVECNVAMQRYIEMFLNERNKIAKLKWHEKDFLFLNMRSLIDSQGHRAFDLFDIAEADDYIIPIQSNDRFGINGFDVYADIYTYCHVLIRHYYPQMNTNGIGGTLNSNIKAVEMNDLPVSLLRLVRLHSEFSSLTTQTQFLLYEFEGEKYIMWLKYKNLGYRDKDKEIRICSFYKCIHPRDLDRYVDKTPNDIIKDLITVYT